MSGNYLLPLEDLEEKADAESAGIETAIFPTLKTSFRRFRGFEAQATHRAS
jgi:hypothetical protein